MLSTGLRPWLIIISPLRGSDTMSGIQARVVGGGKCRVNGSWPGEERWECWAGNGGVLQAYAFHEAEEEVHGVDGVSGCSFYGGVQGCGYGEGVTGAVEVYEAFVGATDVRCVR